MTRTPVPKLRQVAEVERSSPWTPSVLAALALFVSFFLGLAGAARADGEGAKALLQRGEALLDAHDPAQARAAFEEAARDPEDADAAASALFHLGEMDEVDLEFARAFEHYQASVARSPSSRYASRARVLADSLQRHSEGGFVPLARTERLRRDKALSDDPAAVAAFAEELESFPPGFVRVEARLLVAEAYLGRLGQPDLGIAELRKVLEEPKIEPLTAREAARRLVEALSQKGDYSLASKEARALKGRLDPVIIAAAVRAGRRPWYRAAAIADLALVVGLAATSLFLARRRGALGPVLASLKRTAPLALLFIAYVAICGGLLASKYEDGDPKPFLVLGVVLAPVLFVSRAWGAGGPRRALRRSPARYSARRPWWPPRS